MNINDNELNFVATDTQLSMATKTAFCDCQKICGYQHIPFGGFPQITLCGFSWITLSGYLQMTFCSYPQLIFCAKVLLDAWINSAAVYHIYISVGVMYVVMSSLTPTTYNTQQLFFGFQKSGSDKVHKVTPDVLEKNRVQWGR